MEHGFPLALGMDGRAINVGDTVEYTDGGKSEVFEVKGAIVGGEYDDDIFLLDADGREWWLGRCRRLAD